ncbi:hypothetical protein BKA61DRAFT_668147 [Leptodontidium sp. MPI-SDFR-AT-0119]|nr:hypothetical protein BKA61DRAFT_668147 [Leptodontidium sp. MPI-SDFR-AT-0119]
MGSNVSHVLGSSRTPAAARADVPPDEPDNRPLAQPAPLARRDEILPLRPLQRHAPLPPPLKKFIVFLKLPAELRLMVWELVLPGERVVRIQEFTECSRHHKPSASCRCIGSKARVPTLLHVCRETRLLALKSYTIAFKNRLLKPTYFNPKVDILLFASVDDFFKFACPVAFYHILKIASLNYFGPYHVTDTHGFPGTPPRRYTDDEKIEDKLRYLAIGRSNPLPCHQVTGKTPWEEFIDRELINLLGEFGNLDTLFVEGIYFEDLGLHPAPPPSAGLIVEKHLKRRWNLSKDALRDFPELVAVGATKMKQMRFRARESRLHSWARLAELLL